MSIGEILTYYSNNPNLWDIGETAANEINRKVEKMYEELIDVDYEYTFDEFGEYLLYLFMLVMRDAYEDEGKSQQSSLSRVDSKDFAYIASRYKHAYRELLKEDAKEDDGDLQDWLGPEDEFVKCRLINTMVFPYMDFCMNELDGDFSCVYWDIDFSFYDEAAGGNVILNPACRMAHGFVTGSEEQEPVSGSLKFKIEKCSE